MAYISVILSTLMLCEESLKNRRNATPTLTELGANLPTTKLLFAIATLLLWLVSLIYSTYGWIVYYNSNSNDRLTGSYLSNLRAAISFYLIFHTLSVLSWVRLLENRNALRLQYFDFLETGLCCHCDQTTDDDDDGFAYRNHGFCLHCTSSNGNDPVDIVHEITIRTSDYTAV